MSEKEPTAEEWGKLYAAAGRVKEMAPWAWMMEDEVFGVRNPERDEVGFVSVMGAGGEHFAVALYQGAGALYDFLALSEAAGDGRPDGVGAERVLEIPQLQASFEDRGHLQKEDRDTIKKLGLKFRGANSWPLFRNYAPGMFPWFLTSSEARFLTTALEQLLDVAPRVRDDEDVLYGEDDNDFLVRVPRVENARLVWEDKIMRVPEPELKEATPAPLDPQLLESLKQLPEVTNVIEIELTMLPMPVREKKARPFFPYLLMLVDESSGVILGNDMLQPMPSLDAMRAEFPTKVAEHLMQLGARPLKIAVRTETTARSLAPLAEELGIRIKLSPSLPALDEAMEFMGRMFR
ncbi:MAG TPA: hypothetical protein VG324_00075 [Blastocatellia bacterium]|nr:hypothetical protein [Blastocatellia bacterium]